MAYLYASNLDSLDRRDQLEFQLDDGTTAILRLGHYYDLSANELARARRYIVLTSSSLPADEEPIGVRYLPIKGNPDTGDVPVWDETDGAFTPQVGGGGSYVSAAASPNGHYWTLATDDSGRLVTTDVGTTVPAGTPFASATEMAAIQGSFVENTEDWHGTWHTIGNAPGSIGFAGTPTAAPATTITSGVTFPLSNTTIPVTDTSVLSVNGGSFTLGGKIVVYSGRSTSSGAGNATGAYSLSTESGTVASGTALGFTSIGFGALAIYEKFGEATPNRPIPGTTQGAYLLASYYGPTVDDSAEGFSVFAGLKDTGTPFAQHKPVTGFEAIAQIEGGNTSLDGDTAPLLASGSRTNVVGAASHVKTVAGHKLSHNSSGGPPYGFSDRYYGVWQAATALSTYTTLNGAATLPQATIPVVSGAAMPPATATNPVTVKLGANADGVGGQLVTYTGISTNNLTGCTGGTGTVATGSRVTNDVMALNVKDRLTGVAGFEFGDTGLSASMIAALRGGSDGDVSMLALTGPTNAEISGGLTLLRLNAGSGQTKSIMKVYDTGGNNRFSISSAAQLILDGSALNLQSSSVASGRIDSTGYIQPGVSTTAGAGATAAGAKIYSGTGAPALVGVVGDWYIRTNGGVGTTLYRCTTAGAAGVAVWTAIL